MPFSRLQKCVGLWLILFLTASYAFAQETIGVISALSGSASIVRNYYRHLKQLLWRSKIHANQCVQGR